jgi:hypothetical protein
VYAKAIEVSTYAQMLEHLIVDDPTHFSPAVQPHDPKSLLPLAKADPSDIVDAQAATSAFLEGFDDVEPNAAVDEAQRKAAREAFTAMTAGTDVLDIRTKLTQIKVPQAVQHLVGMLSAYDWEFMEQAKELRGYAVSQILEETKHPDAKIRLKALDMLGKVTEVALFTERVEVRKTQLSDSDLDAKIKEKLNRFMGVIDAEDVSGMSEPLPADPLDAGEDPVDPPADDDAR